MRKLLTSAIVLSLLAGTSALAQNQGQDRHPDRSQSGRQHEDSNRHDRVHAPAPQQARQQEHRRQLNIQREHVQQQQRHVQQQQRHVQAERAQVERRREHLQVQRRVVLEQHRRWDRPQDRSWYEGRWGSRARHFDARMYRRAFYSPRRYRIAPYARPSGWYYRRWGVGASFPMAWLLPNYFIDSWTSYGLVAPPWGYEWVRYGPDVVLVDVRTGRILQVRYNVFY